MIIENQKMIRTMGKNAQLGTLIDQEHYEAIKSFLLNVLEQEKSVFVHDLIAKCHDHFYPQFRDNTGWLLYKVKIDLEVRGLIIHRTPPHRRIHAMVSKAKKAG